MNLILRVILASMVSLPVAAIFLVVGMGILFLTPFTATPLFGRLPRVSESFCPEGAGLVVERYSRSSLSQAKNDYRVICFDSAGKRVADVSNQANLAALGASAMVGYLIAWLALFRLVRRLVEEKTIREKWFLLWTFSAGVALLVWGAIYVYRQPTNPEREQAMMVTLAVAVVLAAVFLTAHRYLLKRIGRSL
jgi:amino acid transporter